VRTVACDSYRGGRGSYSVLGVKKGDIPLAMAVANRSGLEHGERHSRFGFHKKQLLRPTQPLSPLRRLIQCCY
jgi:hypothetical protein